ncbi:MAG: formate dehydrogenase beta subunit [Parvularculaceae bacterium]
MAESYTVYIPQDSSACSVGANEVAKAVADKAGRAGLGIKIIRTGSRGAFWLEPLVEVEIDGKRVGYGPVVPEQVGALFEAKFYEGGKHSLSIGVVDAHPFFSRQERLTFARCGLADPLDLDAYRRLGGLKGLQKAAGLSPEAIVEAVTESGLRGRGGAGFPTGIKWKTALAQKADRKFICCNADEGDSGTFADRMLMEGDPFLLLEGMIIAGFAVGAEEGLVYIRSEYPAAINVMTKAVAAFEEAGLLGDNIADSGRAFRIEIRRGAGAYICGEESSMLDSLEGKRGEVRARPPIPAVSGLFGKPTIVNNVLTLAAVPFILSEGAKAYKDYGEGRSRGTQPFQLAGNIKRGGLVEKAFGVTLRELIEDFGAGTLSGDPLRAVQVGGPLGAYLSAGELDLPMEYEALAEADAMLGHGGVVVFDETVDMARQAEFSMRFCAVESCGKCTPCRIGAVRGAETLAKIRAGENVAANVALLEDLCEVMTDGSLCAMGGLTPMPVLSALKKFPGDFDRIGAPARETA